MIDDIRDNKFEVNWRSLVEHSPERIITLDRNGIILFINRAAPNRTVEDVIGKSVYNLLPLDEQKKLNKILNEVFETGKPHKYISKIVKKNGSEVWYKNSVDGIKENGKLIAAIINSIDITELKRSELKVKESAEKYRNLIDNIVDTVVEIDLEGTVSYISPQITQILGYTPEELLGTNGYLLVHPDDLERFVKITEDAIRSEIPIYIEYNARHKDGHYIPMSTSGNYFKIGDKEKIIAILRDDTEKKETGRRLREAEEKYRSVFEKSSNAIILLDFTGRIIECNSTTLKIFGYSKEEFIGQNYLNLPFYSESVKETLKERFQKISKGFDMKSQELEIKKKDGNLAIIKTKISYIKVGNQNFFEAIIQDITDQKKAEEQLKESEEKFRIIAENSLVGIVIIQNNTVIYTNETIAKITEYSPQEMMKWSVKEMLSIVHPDDKNIAIQQLRVIKKEELKDSPSYPFKIITKSGKTRWVIHYSNIILYRGKEAILGSIIDITEKKLAEEKLIDSEEKYRLLFNQYRMLLESITDGVYALNRDWEFILVNKNAEKIFNMPISNILGHKLYKVFPGIENTPFFKTYERVMRSGNAERVTEFIQLPDGLTGYYEVSVYPIKEGILCIAKDVSEEKEIQQKLKKSEETLKKFMDSATDSFFLLDAKLNCVDLNKASSIMLGLKKEEVIGKNILNVEPNLRETGRYDKYLEVIKTGKPFFVDDLILNPRFGDIYLSVSAFKVGDGLGIIATDITKQKKIEQKLRESEEKFRTIADQSLIGIDILQNGKVMYVNNALSTIVGFPIEEISNWKPRDYHKLIYPEDLNRVYESIAKVQRGKSGSTIRYSCRIITKNKKIKWVEIFAKLIMFRGKKAILSSTIDITSKMEAEQKLREINQMKSELLRRTSHELKTPLVSIKGFSDLLLSLHLDKLDNDVISLIDEIKQGCARLENLIKDILKTSELDLGKVHLKTEMEDLAFLIRFSIKELRGLAEIRKLTIDLDIHDNLITKFEKERIHEVLGNLIINAIKYTPPNGNIKIKTEIKNGFYIVSVKDNGIGFTKKEISKIFTQFGKIERFGQGLDVISEGSGLGLFISKKIIELHGGEIWMDSEGRNKGSTFYFSLPIISD